MKLPAHDGDPKPGVDVKSLKKHGLSDYLTRFAFGAVISATAGVVAVMFGPKVGGVLLGFPAILPASLTLIERKDGRGEAAVNAIAAILGGVALVAFAIVAGVSLKRLSPVVALMLATAAWLVLAFALYVSILWLPRRRRRSRLSIVKPTST